MLFVIRNLTTCIEQNSLKIAIPFDYRNDMNEMCNKTNVWPFLHVHV